MTALYQSPFLIALGWAIAASIWQTALLWVVYQATSSIHRKITPSFKHLTAFVLLLLSFGWFSLTLLNKYSELLKSDFYLSILPGANENVGANLFNITLPQHTVSDFLNQYLPYLSASYLIVLLFLSLKLIRAYLYSERLQTKGLLEIDSHWIALMENYAQKIGITKKVHIHLSQYISVPATLNFFKPVILIPLTAFNNLTTQQVASILLHELSHIKRNDYLVNLVASVIGTMLFFNPFVYLLSKTIKKEREHCCDDFVLQQHFDPHGYASALLSLEQLRKGSHPLAIAAIGQSNHLLDRVKRIMKVKTTHFNYRQKLLSFVLTTFIMIAVAWFSPASHHNMAIRSEDATYTVPKRMSQQRTALAENKTASSGNTKTPNGDIPAITSYKSTIPRNTISAPASPAGNAPFVAPSITATIQVMPPQPPSFPAPPPPPKPKESSAKNLVSDMYIASAPTADVFGDYPVNLQNDLINTDAGQDLSGWWDTNTNILKEQMNNTISITDLIKFLENYKIKPLLLQNQSTQIMSQEQSRILLKNGFNEMQLQYKKIFIEEKMEIEHPRELAETQKERGLNKVKERNITDEKNSTAVYELIVRVEHNINSHSDIPDALQKNISAKRVSSLIITQSRGNVRTMRQSPHRTSNTRGSQSFVISL